ncbi:ABC transporter permease [Paenarthrobacter ilicis]|uniref:Transport permease protein n=1 Tax=Paenarthrobacter ilicis TaxID=43665 RepID=A0ABX0THX8_9MICC|nr:ABC transporter permease [Paenarthrobacter ilicis]MBM7794182.1 teichoic acid transport system permease protein [Paenarthrobacter ilicis]NIJ00362.1 teichoic acid transport system permease protein [Paenarthrobacter ilicis]
MPAKKAVLPEPAVVQPLAVDMRRLTRVGARPGFLEYLVQLWDFREFIFYDARARVQSGTRRDRLGSAWLLLNPIFNGLTYYVIFGLLLQTGHGIENYVGYLVIGIFIFQGTSGAITSGARSIHSNKAVVQAFNFPRATLPIGVNIREMMSNVPLILAMLLIITLVPPVEKITWLWLLIIPAIVLQSIFNLGVSLILARVISRVHDATHLIPFFMRAWMYGSAIFYSYERFVTHPDVLAIMKLNPLFNVIDIVRSCVLYAQAPTWQSWATLAVWALGTLLVGMIFFWHGEESYGRG